MNTESIFGSVAVGKDTSGNFRLSPYGLAVRSAPDGRFVARHKDELVDVTDLTFDGSENFVFRIPKKAPEPKKDIVIRSDSPFSALFVDEVLSDGRVRGTDPATGDVQEYRPVTNLVTQLLGTGGSRHDLHFFVTVSGRNNLFTKKD